MQIVALDAKSMLPIDLIGERVPGESVNRNPRATQTHHRAPLLVQPLLRESWDAVRFAVEERNSIALVVLSRQTLETAGRPRRRATAGRRNPVLARRIVVESEPPLPDRASLAEEAQIVRRHAVPVEQASHPWRQLSPER